MRTLILPGPSTYPVRVSAVATGALVGLSSPKQSSNPPKLNNETL